MSLREGVFVWVSDGERESEREKNSLLTTVE